MGRKTIPVADILERINWQLRVPLTQEEKSAIGITLEAVLRATGNYRGYTYLFDWTAADEQTRKDREWDRCYHANPLFAADVEALRKERLANGGFR